MNLTTAIVCRNHGQFLDQSIDSVLSQLPSMGPGYIRPDELLLIDDHSEDDSLSVMLKWKERFPEIVEVTQFHNHMGHIYGYNHAIQRARGKFFHLMAADDVLQFKYFYSQALRALQYEDIGFVAGGLRWMGENGEPLLTVVNPPFSGEAPSKDWLLAMQNYGNFICGGAVVCRTDFQKAHQYTFELPYSADWMNWIHFLGHFPKAFSINYPVYGYRRGHKNQMTRFHGAPEREIRMCLDEIQKIVGGNHVGSDVGHR